MTKVMISLRDELEAKMRAELKRLYYGRTGGMSIFFEQLLREYFERQAKEKKGRRVS